MACESTATAACMLRREWEFGVCDQAGRVNCIIPTPNGRVSNVCFGGEKFDTLFATCNEKVYKRKVKTKGANAFEAPIKPAAPRL